MTQTTNAFAAYMLENYTHNELAEICNHGCVSGCASGMIYYSETIALFDKYRDELFSIMADYADNMGEPDTLPDYVQKNSGTFATFANSVVWFCAEIVAMYATDGAYIDETEEDE